MSFIPWMMMGAASVAVDQMEWLPQPGETGYTAAPRHHLRWMMENDSAIVNDRNYTHGTRIDYLHDFALEPNHAVGFSFTQNIYTPYTHAAGAVEREHPYAGYLALGVAHLYRGEDVGNCVEFQLGTTGKASGAREVQDMVHKACRLERWHGWNDQIRGEVTFQLSAQQDYRQAWAESSLSNGWQTDGIFYTREELGTVSIAGGAGFSFRVGHNLPPAMQVTRNNSATFGSGTIRKPDYDPADSSYFLVMGASVDYVARDMFIDGGVFHDFDRTCGVLPWQVEGRLGLGVRRKGVDYYAGAFIRSRGYRTQRDNTALGTFSMTFNW
ncbi:MAG: lipid A deacylase LpxR family protein [Akkermansiaceae bacterium]|nr:lipid A deacylase LpxR family protein [Akkermansiaceae bacterium]